MTGIDEKNLAEGMQTESKEEKEEKETKPGAEIEPKGDDDAKEEAAESEGKDKQSAEPEEEAGEEPELLSEEEQRKLVKKLLDKADKVGAKDDLKMTAGDLIRLIQLRKELATKTPRHVTVQWVEDESE